MWNKNPRVGAVVSYDLASTHHMMSMRFDDCERARIPPAGLNFLRADFHPHEHESCYLCNSSLCFFMVMECSMSIFRTKLNYNIKCAKSVSCDTFSLAWC